MVLYGWWYLIGVAIVVVIQLVYLGPSETRFWKKRIEIVQDRIRKVEERKKEQEEKKEQLDREKRLHRMFGRPRGRFIRKRQ